MAAAGRVQSLHQAAGAGAPATRRLIPREPAPPRERPLEGSPALHLALSVKVSEDIPEEVAFNLSHGIEVGQEGEGVRGYSRQRPAPVDGLEVGTREHPFGDL
ncbi:unnamed protein product [Rangifer tarandus platyrhynchus]|uniref:Uncharacterized protein n=1 Tax=Rangifer tarandus platyrhynchus TaxID=3082113 RepID=A0ABN8XVD8_RANTA|nr:unnamed protein product [Rangifer tarandus platyrhynchus]